MAGESQNAGTHTLFGPFITTESDVYPGKPNVVSMPEPVVRKPTTFKFRNEYIVTQFCTAISQLDHARSPLHLDTCSKWNGLVKVHP
jgi:hypothetical protein